MAIGLCSVCCVCRVGLNLVQLYGIICEIIIGVILIEVMYMHSTQRNVITRDGAYIGRNYVTSRNIDSNN